MIVEFAAAVAAGLAAAALTPWMLSQAHTEAPILGRRLHFPLAALGGAGAGALGRTWAEVITFAVLAVAASLLIVIDLAEKRLPDAIVLPLYPIALAGLCVAALVANEWGSFGRALLGGLASLGVYLLLGIIAPSSLGFGDVKLAGPVGLFLGWLGWAPVVAGFVAAWLLLSIVGMGLMAARKASRRTTLPFGPFMVAGAVLGAAWGTQMAALLT